MEKSRMEMIKTMAQGVLDDAIVEASEFLTIPGNTIEKYVDGLLEIHVDSTTMTKEDVVFLREVLKELSRKSVEENKET